MSPANRCMCLTRIGTPLQLQTRALPRCEPHQVLLKVRACGVCRTDLHVMDGELPDIPLPIVPGHEIVAEVIDAGREAHWPVGARVGVPWLGYTCGRCRFCVSGQENLCDNARFTGYQLDGGYAQYVVANAAYCLELPDTLDDVHAAPLLCAGLIGYRSWRMTGDAKRLGIFGFGAAGHLIAQVARWHGQDVFAFTRPGDIAAQHFARDLGAAWAGGSDEAPDVELDAAILFAPVGSLVPAALSRVRKGGIVVCGGIHMSDIPQFPYSLLWGERVVRSVANLTHQDGVEFLRLAGRMPLRTEVTSFVLDEANTALERLRRGELTGAAVLVP